MQKKYSGKKIIKAGESLINDDLINNQKHFFHVMEIISYWRFSHEESLERAFIILQTITKKRDKLAIFAKRLKRTDSIKRKLKRFDKMKLKNMQDIGGCRAVISSEKKLTQVLKDLKSVKEFKFKDNKRTFKNYVKKPKDDGYRGYHIVGKFIDSNNHERRIEVQLRTHLQHYWATAVEIVDLFTSQALKFNQGSKDWKVFFLNVSEQFSIIDGIHLYREMNDRYLLRNYEMILRKNNADLSFQNTKIYLNKLQVKTKLEGFANSLKIIESRINNEKHSGYVLIEIDTKAHTVTTTLFNKKENIDAEKKYTETEQLSASNPNKVVALVSTTSLDSIKTAYPNYFADSSRFLWYLNIIKNTKI